MTVPSRPRKMVSWWSLVCRRRDLNKPFSEPQIREPMSGHSVSKPLSVPSLICENLCSREGRKHEPPDNVGRRKLRYKVTTSSPSIPFPLKYFPNIISALLVAVYCDELYLILNGRLQCDALLLLPHLFLALRRDTRKNDWLVSSSF